MVIEWLKIRVPPEQREEYIRRDDEIWTAALSRYPGFLGKEVWINPVDSTEVVLVIHWASKEAWKSITEEELQQIEQQFAQAIGDGCEIVESTEYQVRKFLQP